MGGYTPAFSDIYMGTLYGKWPAAAVWASLLPLLGQNGEIDMSMQAISGMTGWPLELLQTGIEQLMSPDPNSRTPGEDGRRLVLIDPNRPWGWRAVNHRKYREKARLMAKAAREKESGENADRMKDRRRPPQTAADRPSDSDSDSDSDSERPPLVPPSGGSDKISQGARKPPEAAQQSAEQPAEPAKAQSKPRGHSRATQLPDDFQLTEELIVYATSRLPGVQVDKLFQQFCNHHLAVGNRMSDWSKAWRTWVDKAEQFGYPGRERRRELVAPKSPYIAREFPS